MFYKLLIERAIRSALAAFLATVAAGIGSGETNGAALRALLVAAGASSVSAALTIFSSIVGDPSSTSFIKSAPGDGTPET